MREIKFRAWDKATQGHWQPKPKGMIEFCLHNVPDYIGHTFNENGGVWERRFTVMQYTGLKDKNGRELFESDIVQWGDLILTVEWSDEDCAFIGNSPTAAAMLNQEYLDNFKIIDNLYENPELFEAN